MRRFIIAAVAGASLCLGGANFAQAREVVNKVVTKTVVTKTEVEKKIVVGHVAPERLRHVEVAHWGHSFEVRHVR